MNEPIPLTSNQVAVWVGRILHPFLLPLPTVLVILSGLTIGEALGWTSIVLIMVVLPVAVYTFWMRRTGTPTYLRQVRLPLYFVSWLGVLTCLICLWVFAAPKVLAACMGALIIWLPLQAAINHWVTKISIHAAVASGCFTAILLLGKLTNPWILFTLLVLLILMLWARVVTKNHSILQVTLGVLVGAVPVLFVFPLMLR